MRIYSNAITTSQGSYSRFDFINGEHPYKELGAHGFVEYEVMMLNKGSVIYFNFELAKEMGLIPDSHPNEMNPELHSKLIETFSIQIINEYDILTKKRIAKKNIKTNKFMATRYLQLQHKSKTGLTSGDGRSIWNGVVQNKNKVWDVSSRGTGVTILSPGASAKNKPLKTGNTETGYGCGQAEIDELVGSAIMSEVLHHKGINTERALCVIDLGKGVGIGVRAGQNLLRPAHAFLYLKQNKQEELKKVVDYFIQRQNLNSKNKISNYQDFLNQFTEDLARFSAFIEENYLFVWLDWDGDNVLMEAGIIDYGSIRHFGACHNKYKYDDVDRYSTNLSEQKYKARLLVKEMNQVVDLVMSGKRKSLSSYDNSASTKLFTDKFKFYSLWFFAEKIGLSKDFLDKKMKSENFVKDLRALKKEFSFWENLKVSKGMVEVADGINHHPLVNMRAFARELPSILTDLKGHYTISDFMKLTQTSYATRKDEKIFYRNEKAFNKMLNLFKKFFKKYQILTSEEKIDAINEKLNQVHPENFLTGNSLIHCVDDILTSYMTTKDSQIVQTTIRKLIDYTQGDKIFQRKRHFLSVNNEQGLNSKKLWDKIVMNLHEYCEDI